MMSKKNSSDQSREKRDEDEMSPRRLRNNKLRTDTEKVSEQPNRSESSENLTELVNSDEEVK